MTPLALLLLAACARGGAQVPQDIDEVSGLACPPDHDWLWILEDSGNPAALYTLDLEGHPLGTSEVAGASNIDWEDLAWFRVEGRTWLVIADVGDNAAIRPSVALHLVPEPLVPGAAATVARTVRFRYPDGPHDAEAVGVEPSGERAWIVTKRDIPPRLYAVPLAPAEGVVEAVAHGVVDTLPAPTEADLLEDPVYGHLRSQPTALDLHDDLALLQTYKDAYLFDRAPGEPWEVALRRAPRILDTPQLPQTEAACLAPDGRSMWVSTERRPAPLYRLTVPHRSPP